MEEFTKESLYVTGCWGMIKEGTMLKGKIFDLEEDGLPFVINNEQIIVTPPDTSIRWFSNELESKEIVKGKLSDGRPIVFFGCRYNGRWFDAQGYVYAHSNLEPDALENFTRISFTGVPIDNFSGGVFETFDRGEYLSIEEKMIALTPRPWLEITYRCESEVAGQSCEIMVDHMFNYNLQWGDRQIGTCTPRFSISFPEPVDIKYIPEIYLAVFDFFVFLNFRRCITFDGITLLKQNQKGRYCKTANVFFYSKYKNMRRKYVYNSVKPKDLGDSWGNLFRNIASRRKNAIFDDLFVPEDDADYSTVSHSVFFSCALSFEGEYDRTQPTKEGTNELFRQVKGTVSDALFSSTAAVTEIAEADVRSVLLEEFDRRADENIECLLTDQSKSKQRKIMSYAQKMINELKRVDFSLEEQFNNVLKKYDSIIAPYKNQLADHMKIDLQKSTNLGRVFSDFRNQIGHGHPRPIEQIHAYVFMLGRCLTYIMILESTGLNNEQIAHITKKLFQ